jgi:restriction endonuclease S subunit
MVAGGTPESGDPDNWADPETGVPWVSIGDMTSSPVVMKTERYLSVAGLRSKRLRLLPVGTLLYSIYASLGKVAELGISAATNQAILGLLPNKDLLNQRFLAFWLASFERHLDLLSSSNTQANLNAEKVANIQVCPFSKPSPRSLTERLPPLMISSGRRSGWQSCSRRSARPSSQKP